MPMRTYLTVIDDQPEARVALRFAARRAAKTGGGVLILALVPPAEFVQWAGVQAAMEEEARLRVEAMIAEAVGALTQETGLDPRIVVRQGEAVEVVRAILAEEPDIAALVLGAAPGGDGPGPLVAYFASAGDMPCPVMIIPGFLSDAALARVI